MNIIKSIVFISLIISYGYLLINLIKGYYKNNIRNLCIDIWVSYYLAPLLAIVLIWNFIEKKENKKTIKIKHLNKIK